MMGSVSVLFDTVINYSWYFNMGDFLYLEENTFPINIEAIDKGLEIYGFGIVLYFSGVKMDIWLRSGTRHIIFLGYKNIGASFPHKAFENEKYTRVPNYIIVIMSMLFMYRLTWRNKV